MSGWKSRPRVAASDVALSGGAEDRIHKLVVRAIRHSYGAEAALRNAVRAGATEMLDAGATRETMRGAIAACVTKHPGVLPDKPSLVTGQSRSATVLERMMSWVDELATERIVAPERS